MIGESQTVCPGCGQEMDAEPPLSAMGERMHGRGVDDQICMNPRCRRFGRRR